MDEYPKRKKPASGVHIDLGNPTIVFLTVCTKERMKWLLNPEAGARLLKVWQEASAWRIGYYLFMPDHLHLFCSPSDLNIPLNNWVSYWKRLFRIDCPCREWMWQTGHWDTRLRREESYKDKWEYVRRNPVRAGLVTEADDWPSAGMMNVLKW